MTQYNTLNVKLSNSHLNKLKSGMKNSTEVTLKLSSNVVGDSNSKNNLPHKLLLTNTQVLKLLKAFTNGSSATLHKIRQWRGFLGRLLGPFLKTGLFLIGYVLKPLAKNALIPLGPTATGSATDTAIHKKMFGSGVRPSDLVSCTTLIISNEEMNDIMKIVKSLEESGLLMKGVSQTIKKKAQH